MSFGTIPLSPDDKPDSFVLLSMYEKLESENAKLRELCKEWYRFAYELFDDFVGEPELNEDFMTLDDRLRELGVDV